MAIKPCDSVNRKVICRFAGEGDAIPDSLERNEKLHHKKSYSAYSSDQKKMKPFAFLRRRRLGIQGSSKLSHIANKTCRIHCRKAGHPDKQGLKERRRATKNSQRGFQEEGKTSSRHMSERGRGLTMARDFLKWSKKLNEPFLE